MLMSFTMHRSSCIPLGQQSSCTCYKSVCVIWELGRTFISCVMLSTLGKVSAFAATFYMVYRSKNSRHSGGSKLDIEAF